MTRLRYCWLFLIAAPALSASADTANCTVEIEDVTAAVQSKAAAKQIVQFAFELTPESDVQRKYFQLSDGLYSCTLAFFDLDSGTSLSCERKDDQGHIYVQSDRSGISEHAARNNLIFRDGNSHFVLNAGCE
jgi:hypothetical protein